MAINLISGNILNANLVRGANLAISSTTSANLIFFDTTNGRVGILTNAPQSGLDVAAVLTVGNVSISNVGNIDAGNVWINDLGDPVVAQDAATKNYVDNELGNITANLGNIIITDTTIAPNYSPANITLAPTGNSDVIIDTVSGLVLPVGNTAQRPSPASTGTVRFNSDIGRVEVYDGAAWEDVVANVTNQTLAGDNSTTAFALDRDSTTAATLVIINGIVQLPAVAYTITGNSLNFTQAPAVSDIIDVRFL